MSNLGNGIQKNSARPIRIHVGNDEVLLSDSVRLAERARAAGVEVELKVWPGMWHVFQAFSQGQKLMRSLLETLGQAVSNTLFMENLFEFLAIEPPYPDVRIRLDQLRQRNGRIGDRRKTGRCLPEGARRRSPERLWFRAGI